MRLAFPVATVLMAVGFFLSVIPEEAREPNGMIYLTYVAGGRVGGGAPPRAQEAAYCCVLLSAEEVPSPEVNATPALYIRRILTPQGDQG